MAGSHATRVKAGSTARQVNHEVVKAQGKRAGVILPVALLNPCVPPKVFVPRKAVSK